MRFAKVQPLGGKIDSAGDAVDGFMVNAWGDFKAGRWDPTTVPDVKRS